MGVRDISNISAGFMFILIAALVLIALAVYFIASGTDAVGFIRGLLTLGLR